MIPTSIQESHKVALRSVANKNQLAENELVRLYVACTEILETGVTKAKDVMASKLTNPTDGGNILLSTVTNNSGVFVQLAQTQRQSYGPLLLTIGQKWSMDGIDSVNSQTGTRFF